MVAFAKTFAAAVVASAALIGAGAASAQEYPSRPITILLGSTPGGSSDVAARWYADIVSRNIGQRVVVENRPGAGGLIAADAIAHGPADGYTILFAMNGVHEILPAMQQMSFDPINDFVFITPLTYITNYMIAPVNHPANTLAELVKYAQGKKGGLNFGSTTIGSPSQLMGGLFKLQSGADLEIVNYRGGPELLVDIVAGRTDFAVASFTTFQPAWDDKSVKILAVNSDTRSPRFPNVSTFTEQGYPEISAETWFGLLAQAKTPPAIVNKLYAEFDKASKDPEMRQRAATMDLVMQTKPSEEFRKSVIANKEKLGKVVQVLGLKSNP